MGFSRTILPLGIVFLVVMMIWIRAHYRTQRFTARNLAEEDAKALAALTQSAERLDRRIDALEKVLDAEVPGWRSKQ
jgi:phage shock protein B